MKNIKLVVFILFFSALSLGCDDDPVSPEEKAMWAHFHGKWYNDEYCFRSADIYTVVKDYMEMPKNPNDVPALICKVAGNKITFYYYNSDGSGPFKGKTYTVRLGYFFGYYDLCFDYELNNKNEIRKTNGHLHADGRPYTKPPIIECTVLSIKGWGFPIFKD